MAGAIRTARAVVAGIDPDAFGRATPCTGFTVADLLGHLLGACRRVAAVGRGEDPLSVNTGAPFAPVDDWDAAYEAVAHEIQAAWTDDATLERTVVMPWATMSTREMLGIYTNEVTVHTWDLAHATGQSPDWDPQVLDASFTAMRTALPADGREIAPFADVVPTGIDAPLLDRLVAWNGRRP
ncbi:MAG: TIGR03086 family protein [Actinobacteria bacterium]|nr:TIGR03086 family protein [Actinomycetota bacterium]MBS1900255.1 TIGR03086 family protein [Actinomycetota bacterium]